MLHQLHPDDCQLFEITPRLFLGTYYASLDKSLLKKHGIGFIVNVSNGGKDSITSDLYKQLNIDEFKSDIDDDNQSDIISACSACFEQMVKYPDKNILVHCFAGVSRSVSILIYYLVMTKQSKSVIDALKKIQSIRKEALPNKGFMDKLEKYFKLLC